MAEEEAVSQSLLDHPHKRKLDEMEPDAPDVAAPDSTFEVKDEEENSEEENGDNEASEHVKRPRLDEAPDGLANENGHKLEDDNGHADNQDDSKQANKALVEGVDASQPVTESEQKLDAPANPEGQDVQEDISVGKDAEILSSGNKQSENEEKPSEDKLHQMPATEVEEKENAASDQHNSESDGRTITRRMEIPNNKVGVLIGKSGDTIKYLQLNSGAKIQITRDADADPNAPTRPLELVGTAESLNKAERLIKDVIAEADAGGSPSLIARGFTASMSSGSAEVEMPVPSDKVGIIIGRGGETIRSLQTRSGARIQLIPQSSAGDQSNKEKKVKVTGDKKQVEMAIELIKEVMNQMPGRSSQISGNNYNQQHGYRPPRGHPGGPSQWGARGPPSQSMPPYDGHQRGPYPSQGHSHYPPQPYGNYPPPRPGFGGWDNRPPQAQGPPLHHSGGYDYYGGQANAPSSAPQPTHMPGHHASSMVPHSQGNYNYGQPPRGTDYSQPTPYPQSAPPAQGYGNHSQGYPPQHQQGGYAPPQQQYNRPPQSYGAPPPQGYAVPTPTANQPPADGSSYQAPPAVSGAPQPYGQPQQQQQAYPQAPYGQTQPSVAPNYPQQSGAPYGQQPGGYAQATVPAAGYGQYPQAVAQPGYVDPAAATAAPTAGTYGYPDPSQAAAYGAAGQAAGQVYAGGPTVAAQQGYAQQGYDQSAAQSGGYASAPVTAAAYGKTTVPPQTQAGYPPQYDPSQQMYAAPPR